MLLELTAISNTWYCHWDADYIGVSRGTVHIQATLHDLHPLSVHTGSGGFLFIPRGKIPGASCPGPRGMGHRGWLPYIGLQHSLYMHRGLLIYLHIFWENCMLQWSSSSPTTVVNNQICHGQLHNDPVWQTCIFCLWTRHQEQSIPTNIRLIGSHAAFRRALKTHLFNTAFNSEFWHL